MLAWMEAELARLRAQGLERCLREQPLPGGLLREGERTLLSFASNDYLGLASEPTVIAAVEAALRRWGAGAGASRLVSGTLPCHTELETRLAALKGYPAALVFGSGFLANVGILPALVGRGDWIVADKLAHASLLDGAILSRATLHRFRHNEAGHLREVLRKKPPRARCLVVTESVFSMDGDCAPLADLAQAALEADALLMVDEAHATGVFGPGGSGLIRAQQLEQSVPLSMGTLSKALGGYGGFIACADTVRQWLVNKSRSFIFSTALPPPVVGAALGALDWLVAHPEAGAELLRRAERLRARLREAGLDTGASASQIVPLMVGDQRKAVALAERLRAQGILAPAIRPPTVPAGTARLRLSVTLAHTHELLETAADRIIAAARAEGLC